MGELHVKNISPIPANPKAVSFLPPSLSIICDNSAIPLVIIADFAFSPSFNPSDIPVPIAKIFLIAPESDAPITSFDG